PAPAPPDLAPAAPSRAADSASFAKRRRVFSTGWQQLVEKVPMEGTSGSTDSVPLRGGTEDAALARTVSRERSVEGSRDPALREGGAGGWDRCGSGSLRERDLPCRCSSLRGPGSTTRGVRADRVGVALSPRGPQGRTGAICRNELRLSRPLAREPSARTCR